MPIRESTVFHRNRNALPSDVLSRREARLAELAAEVRRNEMPAYVIEPRRGLHRPVVVLTITDGTPAAGARVEPCVKAAAAAIGIKDCSVCEAIRKRRPARGHVLRYLDQVERQGVVRDGYFHAAGRLGRLPLSDRERKRLRELATERVIAGGPMLFPEALNGCRAPVQIELIGGPLHGRVHELNRGAEMIPAQIGLRNDAATPCSIGTTSTTAARKRQPKYLRGRIRDNYSLSA